jgi:hypothetical protein
MHLHGLTHMLAWIGGHAGMTVRHAWVYASGRGLIRGHHLVAMRLESRATGDETREAGGRLSMRGGVARSAAGLRAVEQQSPGRTDNA